MDDPTLYTASTEGKIAEGNEVYMHIAEIHFGSRAHLHPGAFSIFLNFENA